MRFYDISTDTQDTYRLKKNEQAVFFMHNRTGEITFELAGPGAAAHIFAFEFGAGAKDSELKVVQKHLERETYSTLQVKSILKDQVRFKTSGLIRIEPGADKSQAFQESRTLLLSKDAQASTVPALEILADDVVCKHAAAAGPLNSDALFYAESRGLSRGLATELLINGFLADSLQKMAALGVSETDLARIPTLTYA